MHIQNQVRAWQPSKQPVQVAFRGDYNPPEPQEPLVPAPKIPLHRQIGSWMQSMRAGWKEGNHSKGQFLLLALFTLAERFLPKSRPAPAEERFLQNCAAATRQEIQTQMDHIASLAPSHLSDIGRYFRHLPMLEDPYELHARTADPRLPKLTVSQTEAAKRGVTPLMLHQAIGLTSRLLRDHQAMKLRPEQRTLTLTLEPQTPAASADVVSIKTLQPRIMQKLAVDEKRAEHILRWILEVGAYVPDLFASPISAVERGESHRPGTLALHLKPKKQPKTAAG